MKNILLLAILASFAYSGGSISPIATIEKTQKSNTLSKQDSQGFAEHVIKKAFLYLKEKDQIKFTAEMSETGGKDGSRVFYKTDVKVMKPMQFKVHAYNDIKDSPYLLDRTYSLNRGIFTVSDKNMKKFGSIEVPWAIDDALFKVRENFGIVPPLASFMRGNLLFRFNPKKAVYFDTLYRDEVLCTYVAFSKGKYVFHLWIRSEGNPDILGYSIIDTKSKTKHRIDARIIWDDKKAKKMSNKDFMQNSEGYYQTHMDAFK